MAVTNAFPSDLNALPVGHQNLKWVKANLHG